MDKVYGAIADPTRRAILAELAHGEANVGDIAGRFPVSLNNVSKHLKVLEKAGLIERNVRGREHRLTLKPGRLREAAKWFAFYEQFWTDRLEALDELLTGGSAASKPRRATKTKRR